MCPQVLAEVLQQQARLDDPQALRRKEFERCAGLILGQEWAAVQRGKLPCEMDCDTVTVQPGAALQRGKLRRGIASTSSRDTVKSRPLANCRSRLSCRRVKGEPPPLSEAELMRARCGPAAWRWGHVRLRRQHGCLGLLAASSSRHPHMHPLIQAQGSIQ